MYSAAWSAVRCATASLTSALAHGKLPRAAVTTQRPRRDLESTGVEQQRTQVGPLFAEVLQTLLAGLPAAGRLDHHSPARGASTSLSGGNMNGG
jgi:hypothetical protein